MAGNVAQVVSQVVLVLAHVVTLAGNVAQVVLEVVLVVAHVTQM